MPGPASTSSDQILLTKIQVPRLRPQRVERSRLSARLEQGAWGRLTLVCAPAGFGKTTLLADWARQSGRTVAWLALDDGDNIPDRFFTYLVAALARVLPGVGEAAQAMLRGPQPVQPEALIASLINDLAASAAGTQPAVLVLDDYHLIQAPPIQAAVEYLVDHLPDGLHLVIAGRADPPLSLARLRARGEMNELRGPDLRFNTQETADFLNQVMGLALSAAEVEALEARTEGWIAGLQLAALSMQDRKDVDRFIKVFTGSHRYILDYLVEEVLRRQPEDIQAFLLKTSILERLCGPLCDAILKDEGSRMKDESEPAGFILHPSSFILDLLEHSNLFLISLDDERHWYRYHTLFADLLRYRLEQTFPDQVEGLHRRAAAWYQANGLPMEAVAHWIAAKEWSQAAQQVQTAGEVQLNHGQGSAFMGWLDRLPAQVFEALPRLHLLYAWSLMQISQFARLEARLQEAERAANVRLQEAGTDDAADRPEMRLLMGEITATRAIMASMGGDMARVIQLSEQALADLPGDHTLRCTVLFSLGIARLLAGETRRAERVFAEVAAIAQQTGQLAAAATILANLGDARMILGDLEQARQAFTQAVSLAPKENPGALPVTSLGYAGLAFLEREQWNLSLAREHILKAIELDELWGNRDIHTVNLARLAQVYFSCGEVDAGWEALDRAAEIAREQRLTAMARIGFDTTYHLGLPVLRPPGGCLAVGAGARGRTGAARVFGRARPARLGRGDGRAGQVSP